MQENEGLEIADKIKEILSKNVIIYSTTDDMKAENEYVKRNIEHVEKHSIIEKLKSL